MTPKEWMDGTYHRYEDVTVRVISIPLPPINTRGILYAPDGFASKTFDFGGDFDFGHTGVDIRAASIVPSAYGPAILLSLRFGDLIEFADDGYLAVKRAAVCATVSYRLRYDLKHEGQKIDVADDATIDQINFKFSCNPGSHITVPKAPFLTAMLQYAISKTPSDDGYGAANSQFRFLDADQGEELFPGWGWSKNVAIDRYLSLCAVDNAVRYGGAVRTGLGEWSVPYLRQLRTNQILMENDDGRYIIPDNSWQEDGRLIGSGAIGGGTDPIIQE